MSYIRRLSSVAQTVASHRPFPSLILGGKSITPIGSFAEATAEFLQPDQASVKELQSLMRSSNTGIVAHYYMDVELQGILHAANNDHNNHKNTISIADSLAMGDAALSMAQSAGSSSIACLGVDFMSESVQAILQHNQMNIPVYRLADRKIGCSLAESAERDDYTAWLKNAAAASNNALHVVYINTSLETKAHSHSILPTITCTSSNVLQTLLNAAIQIPNVQIYYGPDTYMGENLKVLLQTISEQWDDETIQTKLHPSHTKASIAQLHDDIHVFPSGNCVVHHMFGANVVDTVRNHYVDSYITAHLEVPGEMFQLANEASMNDRGVVGSTSNILQFITHTVRDSSERNLSFILGTEAGMVTSIVRQLQKVIRDDQTVEIVFPVASEAISIHDSSSDMPIVPGVSASEGCSTAGGCATCPFMKMNDFDALLRLLTNIERNDPNLQNFRPENRLHGTFIRDRPAMEWAIEPITYMRYFGQHGRLPEDLIRSVTTDRRS